MHINKDAVLSYYYDGELQSVLSNNLFGERNDFLPLDLDDKLATNCYAVHKMSSAESETFERVFHLEFWPKSSNKQNPQLMILTGPEGVGKSTFINYYFRYYLPHYVALTPSTLMGGKDLQKWRDACKDHVILYVNLHRVKAVENLEPYIFKCLRSEIRKYTKICGMEIDSEDAFSMWDEVVGGWDSGIHSFSLQASGLTKEQYRAKYLTDRMYDSNDELWVRAAISYLGKQESSPGWRRWFISIVLDDSDQMPEVLQSRLLGMVLGMIRSTPRIGPAYDPEIGGPDSLWKIIMPLRPETMAALYPELTPIENTKEFQLPMLDHVSLLQAQKSHIRTAILEGQRVFYFIHAAAKGVKGYLDTVPPEDAVDQMCDQLEAAYITTEEDDFGSSTPRGTSGNCKTILEKLINNSARRSNYCRLRYSLSRTVQGRLARFPGKLSQYFFLDGLITGRKGVYDPNEEGNLIINLFNIERGADSYRDRLVVVHALHFLNQGFLWNDVLVKLGVLGYRSDDCAKCRDFLIAKRVLRNFAAYRTEPILHSEKLVVESHLMLLEQPSYIDNMAMATYIGCGRVYDDVYTDVLNYKDLVKRVDVTIEFINDIKLAEEAVVKRPVDLIPEINRMKLPRLFHLCGLPYAARLKHLPKGAEMEKYLALNPDEATALQSQADILFAACSADKTKNRFLKGIPE